MMIENILNVLRLWQNLDIENIFIHIYNFWGNVLSLEDFLEKFLEKLMRAKSSFKRGYYIRSYKNY